MLKCEFCRNIIQPFQEVCDDCRLKIEDLMWRQNLTWNQAKDLYSNKLKFEKLRQEKKNGSST